MNPSKEKRILEIIWMDIEAYRLWDKYLDIVNDATLTDKEADLKCAKIRKEIDHYEKKMLDISKGISYTDILKVKEKYDLDAAGIIYGIFDSNW